MPAGVLRVHFHIGPALGRIRLPLGPAVVSAILHVVLLAIVVFSASMWSDKRTKPVYVVLAPATAAIGSPKGVPMPPRVEEPPAPQPAPPAPAELPRREASRDLPSRDLPSRDLPSRDLPPARDAGALPDRTLPARATARLRPAEKELPTLPNTQPTPAPTTTPPSAPARREASAAPPPPPQPLGAATGSASGAGPLTLSVSDFPYAYYIRQVAEKIRAQWNGKAIPGQQPVVIFEIRSDGRLNLVSIDKSSGNAYYDQVALRAINDAGPFPPLPEEFKKPMLRIGLQFVFDPTGG